MPLKILMSASDLQRVQDELANKRKIQAIKLVRNCGRILSSDDPSRDMSQGIGLREAKIATESLLNLAAGQRQGYEAIIVPEWRVHSLVVSGPEGVQIELDLETLQMHFLASLSSVGLEEVGRLLDLVAYIQKWHGAPMLTWESEENQ